MYCPKCGKPIPNQNRFCGYCGYRMPDLSGPAAVQNEAPIRKKGRGLLIALIIGSVVLLTLIALILFVLFVKPDKTESKAENGNQPAASAPSEPAPADPDCYSFPVGTCSWSEACEKAKGAGGRLAAFGSREEYDAVTAELDARGLRGTEFRLGARRDPDGTDYYWVDENGNLTGESLNDPASWAYPLWNDGEPTYRWQENEETTVVLYYDEGAGRWCLNDIPDEPYGTDRYGYIVIFDTPEEARAYEEEAKTAPELPELEDMWLGVWTADSGERLEIGSVSTDGLSCVFYKQTESGEWMNVDYPLEFDNEEKTIASEIGGPEDHGGWEYTFLLGDGYITAQSRYPDQIFTREQAQVPATVSGEDLTALEDFLTCFSCHGNETYDCRQAATLDFGWQGTLLESVIGHPNCVSYTLYPGEDVQVLWGETDPLGRWESHAKFNETQVHWILKNIMNCTEADISALNEKLIAASDEIDDYGTYQNPYYLDGNYYRQIAGVGWEICCLNPEVSFDGTYYLVKYDLGIPGYSVDSTRYAVMRLKTIDGEKYWSVYYDGEAFPEDMDFSGQNGGE